MKLSLNVPLRKRKAWSVTGKEFAKISVIVSMREKLALLLDPQALSINVKDALMPG